MKKEEESGFVKIKENKHLQSWFCFSNNYFAFFPS